MARLNWEKLTVNDLDQKVVLPSLHRSIWPGSPFMAEPPRLYEQSRVVHECRGNNKGFHQSNQIE
jgi:hypothetical protein